VGIGLANLRDDTPIQLALPLGHDRAVALDLTLDDVRDRFGSAAMTRAVLLGRHPGITMLQLPD
jgi:DNA polymerase IV